MVSNSLSSSEGGGGASATAPLKSYTEKFIELFPYYLSIGMTEEQLEKIWDRFYQADPSRSGNEQGSMGLGLSMAQEIAHVHGATLCASGTLGMGSSFTLHLKEKRGGSA